jgi:hypothetical protein
MALPAPGLVPALRDAPLRDRDGLLLGRVGDVLFDAVTNRPAWVVVLLSDGRATLAPAARARHTVDGMRLPVAADAVRDCPAGVGDVAVAARHYGVRRFARDEAAAAARFTCAGPALDGARAA